jgi:hypothetical protein
MRKTDRRSNTVAAASVQARSGVSAKAADPAAGPAADPALGPPSLGPELQAQIGHHLRAMYQEVLDEPIPDRFLRALEALERSELDKQTAAEEGEAS